MRPLVVLLIVLGALAALLFALTTLTGSGRKGEDLRGLEATTAVDSNSPKAQLVQPQAPTEASAAARTENTDTRQAPQGPQGARKLAYGAIEGIVVDRANDRPIAEATVSLLNARPASIEDLHLLRGEEPPRPVQKAVTDEKGTFRFEQLDPNKDWSLVVSHARYLTYSTDSTIPVPEGGAWTEKIALELGQTLSGSVRDAQTHQPVPGATLSVDSGFAAQTRKRTQTRIETQTDANGVYVFNNVGATVGQSKTLTVSAPGYATQVHPNFALVNFGEAPTHFKNRQPPPGLEPRQQDFELEPGKQIAGKVVGPEQRGIAGIELEAMSQTGQIVSSGWGKSGANGEFLIEGLAEGIYTVRVTATQYDASPLQRVEAGDTNVLIELFEQASVSGRVLDESGRGLSNFVVKARASNDVSKAFGAVVAQRQVRGAKDGHFELKGVPEGSYVIEALAEGYSSSFSDTLTATQGLETSDVVVRMSKGGSLSGRVVSSYDGAPITGAEVSTQDNDYIDGQIWDLFASLEPTASTKAKVFTDAEGRFSIELMTPGLYQVQVKIRGHSPMAIKDVLVVDGQETAMPPIRLIRGAVIRGTVLGPGSEAQAGATVQLTPADFGFNGHREARTDGSGRFVIDNAEPGSYQLSATRPLSGASNPFGAIADMKQSQIEVALEDGKEYDFTLKIGD
jgi:uncharacterized GH25 family protein